ncbi:MAG: regulatory iron-sulfur-containing complex subunit RicT [Spirochaetes bacterium]|jgi:cell fate regulator YaaT (PSP1 superfamily)|nr:regulatory iron-sulfur-containing complex subunit RicT [Spirochaetota bacterium]
MEYTCLKMRKNDVIEFVHSNNIFLKAGSVCIAETEHGTDMGTVLEIRSRIDIDPNHVKGRVLRVADKSDFQELPKIEEMEQKAFESCKLKAKEKKLDMKLVNVKSIFDKTKIIFYFVAENRIDFRELVRDLASVYRTRIEMRQIGVRDESRMVGGFGPCGRSLCCTKFQGNFAPVSIKMAKEQNLNLNSLKISGTCGRLLCCLDYEYEVYNLLNSELPQYGTKIKIKNQEYSVESVDTLKESVRIYFEGTFLNIKKDELSFNGKSYSVTNEVIERLMQHDEEVGDSFGL